MIPEWVAALVLAPLCAISIASLTAGVIEACRAIADDRRWRRGRR